MRVKVEDRKNFAISFVRDKTTLDIGPLGFALKEDDKWIREEWIHWTIRQHAKSVLGVDIDRRGLEWARRHGFNIIYGDAEKLSQSIGEAKYQRIWMGESIEHFNNPGLALACAREHLDDNGLLAITTPNARHPGRWIRDDNMSPYHLQLYNMKVLKQLLWVNGFGKVEEHYLEGNPQSLKGKLYVKLFLRLFPKFALTLGIVAKKSGGRK